MFFEDIVYGIQYYRAPTPLPTEWEEDLSKMVDRISIDTIQLRIQWRQNERREGEYNFSDLDKLFELSEKYNLKIIMKFLLENAPQYVYDKYDGYRRNADNTIIRGCSHGAFYVGGWLPCFHNEKVKERAELFVRKVAERYSNKKNIILWNVWNEPRNRPVGECYCPACHKGYAGWLKEKYGTIEDFNDTFGTAEGSFETVQLPATTHGYWDVYLFKKWTSGRALYDNLKFVYDGIREFDKERPIMSHSGFFSGHQKYLDDLGDESEIKKAVDFYGTSFPVEGDMQERENALETRFTADFMRGIDKNFFVHEIYPSAGQFVAYDKPTDLQFKLWSILGAGAKGMVYWQYRAERLGCENDCSGIVNMDGTDKDVTATVKAFGDFVHKYGKLFANAKAEKGKIAIGVDYDSRLLSAIEDGTDAENTYNMSIRSNPVYYYHHAMKGGYHLFIDLGYPVDFVNLDGDETFVDYKVMYLPYYNMADTKNNDKLKKFVDNGGVLICDEGFALRDRKNTWLQIHNIPFDFMSAKIKKRRLCRGVEKFILEGSEVSVNPYRTWYQANGKTLVTFKDGESAIQEISYGKGKILLLSTSMGYSYKVDKEQGWRSFMQKYLAETLDIQTKKYANVVKNVHHQTLYIENGTIEIIQNYSQDTIKLQKTSEMVILTEEKNQGNVISLKPAEVICFLNKN